MAKIIGFREDFKREYVTIGEDQCYEIKNLTGLTKGLSSSSTPYFNMVHNGPDWSIGYQRNLRFFLDDGSHVDFKDDLEGQVNYLKDYIQNGNDTAPKVNTIITEDEDFIV